MKTSKQIFKKVSNGDVISIFIPVADNVPTGWTDSMAKAKRMKRAKIADPYLLSACLKYHD